MTTLLAVALHYLIAINLLTFFAYGHDKWKAENPDPREAPRSINPRKKKKKRKKKRRHGKRIKHARRRTPEATLLILAAVGGTTGALLAMHIFRHKTRHRKFTLGVPLMLALQVLAAVAVYVYYRYTSML